ncbi:PQQ-binding-like beta-propeller repeat protein [Candidatus Poribacteria bacterium]
MRNLSSRAKLRTISLVFLFTCIMVSNAANAEDWATYRYDSARSGVTSEKLTAPLSLYWTLKPTHSPKPAWPAPGEENPRMHFDSAYHVTASDGKIYFGSSVDNKVYALDSEKGEMDWTFFTEGPVRFAPSIWKDRIYFGSDDGNVYCLKAKNGELVWKYRAGPSAEKVIGNGRMISLWPVRTSVMVDDDVVYFGAGVFPYEGIYICALDAEKGSVIWKNDTVGDEAHELTYGGISPQSYLIATESTLYVPSGRAMPAAFDRKTGRFLRYLSAGKSGGTWALVSEDELIAGTSIGGGPGKVAFEAETGRKKGDAYAWFPGIDMVTTADVSYTLTQDGIKAISRGAYPHLLEKLNAIKADRDALSAMLSDMEQKLVDVDERMNEIVSKQIEDTTARINALATEEEKSLKDLACKWQYDRKGLYCLILAGDTLFAGGDGVIVAVDTKTGKELWNDTVTGKAYGLAATDGRLLVSTDQGDVYSFGETTDSEGFVVQAEMNDSPYPDDRLTSICKAAVDEILTNTEINKGYCLVLGNGTGRLAFEIAQRTDLQVVGLEEDTKRVKEAREKLDAAGVYGSRVVVEQWDLSELPDYFANLIVSEKILVSGKMDHSSEDVFRVLRPYGGVAYMIQPDGKVEKAVRGALEGAEGWTHQYANPQNTSCSEDELVKSPLGVLWFGEPGGSRMLERHAKAASSVSLNGRLFVQGEDVIMAHDAYNGTRLWQREIPGAVRARTDVDGGNLSLTENGLYVACYDKCYWLDPATGETIEEFEVPASADGTPRRWGHIANVDNTLYGTAATPLTRGYFPFWTNGKWKAPDEISAELKEEYDTLKARYPEAGNEMWEAFKRSGYLWRTLARFPSWENYNPTKGALTSRMLVGDAVFAMNPETGDLKWKHDGNRISNITVTIGDGKVFFAESQVSDAQKNDAVDHRSELIEKGVYEPTTEDAQFEYVDIRTIFCLDADTGGKVWEKTLDLTWCGGDTVATAYHKDGILLIFSSTGSHDAWRHSTNTLTWKRMMALSVEDGHVIWSKPNNSRTRPVIVGDEIYIEPRVCSVQTGEIKMRAHPITGEQVPWEYLRPGHTCAVSSASANMLFYRSASTAFYDLAEDRGLTIFGAIRPGCWINMVPASGVLLFPEGSAGCTCSYPIRSSVVLKHKSQRNQPWNVFVTHGFSDTARHLFVNLGASGDMKDGEGNVWFSYPNPVTKYGGNHYPNYGVKFSMDEKILDGMGFFNYDVRSASIEGTDKPWLFNAGCVGLLACNVPLVNDTWGDDPGIYTVSLGFAALAGDQVGQRVFDVKLQGEVVVRDFDVVKEAGAPNKAITRTFSGIKVAGDLMVELVPKTESPTIAQAPILNTIQAIREDAETPKAVKLLAKDDAESLLQEKTLEAYHSVFDAAPSAEIKVQALEGMAAMGSSESLSRIARYCRTIEPILWDYKDPDIDVRDAAIKVCIAVANSMIESDKDRATVLLKSAMDVVSAEDTRQQIVDSLAALGVEVVKNE